MLKKFLIFIGCVHIDAHYFKAQFKRDLISTSAAMVVVFGLEKIFKDYEVAWYASVPYFIGVTFLSASAIVFIYKLIRGSKNYTLASAFGIIGIGGLLVYFYKTAGLVVLGSSVIFAQFILEQYS